ncbi:hypothetical protein BW722_06870 [Lawsonia intracellularis]|uniref:gp436 family protein n=1 Tax=Lawsonia intracellularis TaxID=29546 RepID=UPI000976EC51|nr:DUF1320 domain-containing protein [Lawsonia intracellularis]OMQ01696.1 hypothetical protein BW722_06870 [Lawsonia intracellularis]
MYVQYKDLQTQFGEAEMLALCGDEDGNIDMPRLTEVINQTSSEADSYLGKRYVVPVEPVPPVLRFIVGDMVRYRLTSAEALETSLIVQRYQQAIVWLTKVSQGEIVLPLPTTVNSEEQMVIIDAGTRLWRVTGAQYKKAQETPLPARLTI